MQQSQAQYSNYQGRLYVVALVVLLAFSILSVGTWRWHNTHFVSIHASDFAPIVQSHDAVAFHSARLTDLQAADIVTYYEPQNLSQVKIGVVRSIDTVKHTMRISQTNAEQTSTAVNQSLLIGKAAYRLPYAGYLLDFVRSKLGLVLATYIPALIITFIEIRQLSAEFSAKRYRLTTTEPTRL